MNLSKVEKVRTALVRLIDGGEILIDGRLPPERDLCAQVDISRTTLRKALDLLEAEGKIWRRVGSGTFAGNKPVEQANGLVAVSEVTSPSELVELRLILEPPIARLAALRATRSEIEHLRHCVRKSSNAPDSKAYELWDAALHNGIAAATHNNLIIATSKSMNELRHLAHWGLLRDRILADGAQKHWSSQHEAFVEAIANRDGDLAEKLARQHVQDIRTKLE